MIVLRLASALEDASGKDTTNALISGLSIIIISIVASALLFRLIPGMGDDIVAARRDSYDPASKQSLAAITRPVATLRAGINTHASRDAASRPVAQQSSQGTGAGAASVRTQPGQRRHRGPLARRRRLAKTTVIGKLPADHSQRFWELSALRPTMIMSTTIATRGQTPLRTKLHIVPSILARRSGLRALSSREHGTGAKCAFLWASSGLLPL